MKRLAVLFALLGSSCGGQPPVVQLDLIETPGEPTVASVGRLNLRVQASDQQTPLIDVDVSATRRWEAELEPGALFYAWVQGFVACTGPCVPPEQAAAGDCACVNGGPAGEILRLEGCSPWECVTEDTRFRVTLGPPTPLCPPFPTPSQCPAP